MNTTIILNNGLGADLGPNFNLTANVGTVTPNTATKVELLAGKSVSVSDSATQITVTSTGTCTNSLVLNITGQTTSTTTVGVSSFVLGRDGATFFNACTKYTTEPVTYYAGLGALLQITTTLYFDSNLTNHVVSGYYSDGINWYQCNTNGEIVATGSCATTTTTSTTSTSTTSTTSTSTTSTTTIAPVPLVPITFKLGYSNLTGELACYNYNKVNPITSSYYAEDGSILENGAALYVESALTTRITVGYYSDGTKYWYVSSSCFEYSLQNTGSYDVNVEYLGCDEIPRMVTVFTGTTENICANSIDVAPNCIVTNLGLGDCPSVGTGIFEGETVCMGTTTTTSTSTTSTSTTSTSTSTSTTSTSTSTTSTTTLAPASFSLKYSATSAYDSCNTTNPATTYYSQNGVTLGVGKRLYTNSSLTTYVSIGWYSDGTNWYQIDLANGAIVYTGLCSSLTTTSTTTTSTTSTSTTSTSTTQAPTTTTSTSTTTQAPTTTTSTSTTTQAPTTTTSTSTTTAAGPCQVSLSPSNVDGATACDNWNNVIDRTTYYALYSGCSATNGQQLYTDSGLTTLIPNGYYSNGTNYWLVAGGAGTLNSQTACPGPTTTSTTTSTSTTTAAPTTSTTSTSTTSTTTQPGPCQVSLSPSNIDGATACDNWNNVIDRTTYYALYSGCSATNGQQLYTDSGLTTLIPNNWYSDGTNYFQVVGGNGTLTNSTACPGPTTTTTTLATTTTTTEPPTTTTTTTVAPQCTYDGLTIVCDSTTTTTQPPTTTTSTSTSTSTSTTTFGTTAAPTVDIYINTVSSLDTPITGMTIDGVAVTWSGAGPDFILSAGDNGQFTSTKIGTYDVVISYGTHTSGQRIIFTDSNSVVTCQTLNGSSGTFTITGATITAATTISVYSEDGVCA